MARPVGKPNLKWPREHLTLLGTLPDKEVARILGCHFMSVMNKRNELGILPTRQKLRAEHISWLGKVPDSVIAKYLGVVTWAVTKVRKRLGIPAYRRETKN